MDELRLAQLLSKNSSDLKKFEILKDLDVTYTITGNVSASQNKTNFLGYNCLHIAAMTSDLVSTQKFIALGANFLQRGAQDGKTPLHIAVDYVTNNTGTQLWDLQGVLQDHDLVNTLLSAQIKSNNSLNAKCTNGISHLHIACMFNHAEAVLFFARHSMSVDQVINTDSDKFPGFTPLHCAIRYSSLEAAVILITCGSDIYLENTQGINSICYLIERLLDTIDNFKMARPYSNGMLCYPYEKEIERLDSIMKVIALKNKADDSNLIEYTGLSTFHLACMLKDNWIMQSFIKTRNFKNINVPVTFKSKLWSGWTPLHFAACCNIETFKILLANKADIGIKNAKGETAFDLYIQRQFSEETVKHLYTIDTVLSDKTTKLLDLILTMTKYTYWEFLQKLKDSNISVPLESAVWPGYNLLHMSMSIRSKKKFSSVYLQETDNDLKKDEPFNLPDLYTQCKNAVSLFEYTSRTNCSIYTKNANGLTPINLAFKLQEWHILEELLIRAEENVVGPHNVSFLHIACAMGKIDVIERLLQKGADINSTVTSSLEWHNKPKSFFEMSKQNKLPKVFIRANSTLLHIAVIFKMEEVVELLMKRHANVHAEDEHGFTPLHLSLASTKKIAQLLLQGTSNLEDVKREDGLSHLHVAAFANDEEAMQKLLLNGADINGFISNTVPDYFATFIGKTPLHLAVENEKSARFLIEKGADILAENPYCNYETPLDLAMKQLYSSQFKFPFEKLNRKEVKIDALTASGLTTLHIACATLDFDWARKLLGSGANPNALMNDGKGLNNTPMHLIIHSASLALNIPDNFGVFIKLLLQYSADLNISNNHGTPLHLMANVYSNKECWVDSPDDKVVLLTIADELLSNQKSYAINPTDADGFSYFHFACMTNNLTAIGSYLDNGVDINLRKCPFSKENAGFTPLHYAIKYKNENVAQLLIQRGADAKAEDTKGNTALHLAIKNSLINFELFAQLLRKGTDINTKNVKGQTPIICLLQLGNVTYQQFDFFVKHGSTMNIRTKIGNAQGMIGYAMGHTRPTDVDLVFQSIIKLSNIEKAIKQGFRAIHNIVLVKQSQNLTCEHYLKAMQLLTEKGSDIDEQDDDGKRALDEAISIVNVGAIKALVLLGANVNVREYEMNYSITLRACLDCPFFDNHLWKMDLLKLKLNDTNQYIAQNERLKPTDNIVKLYHAELQKIEQTKIFQSLTARHFLSEWGAIIDYPTMSVAKRHAVNDFFKRFDDLRKEFPEFAGLLMMQYRKALARQKLMQPVKDILVEAGLDLPDLCLEAILKYLKNSELQYLIEEANEDPHPCKRRRIE